MDLNRSDSLELLNDSILNKSMCELIASPVKSPMHNMLTIEPSVTDIRNLLHTNSICNKTTNNILKTHYEEYLLQRINKELVYNLNVEKS